MAEAVIAFLTDYGLADDFVGVCHGVISRGCPEARVIDVTHGIGPHDVRSGAVTLARALPYVPARVVLAVVDPGVGGPRRGVAVRAADGRLFVGPDNGLLWPALVVAGGAREAVDLRASPLILLPTAATFHGRDVFSPVAAALAGGAALQDVGEPLDPESLVSLSLPVASVSEGEIAGHVMSIDGFGNLALDARSADLAEAGLGDATEVEVTVGDRRLRAAVGLTFADVSAGETLVYVDGYGSLAIAINRGSAARELAATVDAAVRVSAP